MSGKRYLSRIRRKFPEEDPADIVTMIDILADERAKKAHEPTADKHFEFAASIISILLDPIKPEEYSKRMLSLRLSLKGISRSESLQTHFRKLLSSTLLVAPDAKRAIRSGFEALFVEGQLFSGA